MDTTTDKEFYSVNELQAWLGIGRAKVYELVQTGGEIPSYRIGRKIMVRKRDVESWLSRNRHGPHL